MVFVLKQPKQTEKEIETLVLRYLQMRGIWAWKNNNVGVYDQKLQVYRKPNSIFIIKGISDILGVYRTQPLAIEIKVPGGKLSRHQEIFLDVFNANGGIGFKATSLDDVAYNLENHVNLRRKVEA